MTAGNVAIHGPWADARLGPLGQAEAFATPQRVPKALPDLLDHFRPAFPRTARH